MARIALGGITTESSSFTNHRTLLSDFEVHRGDGILDVYGLEPSEADWAPILRAQAPPGGPVLAAAYAQLEAELLDGLRDAVAAAPLDGVMLELHGAMVVEGREAAEETLVRAVREIVGPDAVIGVAMDPHGNMSHDLAAAVDVASCHRHSPHIDHAATRRRVIDLVHRSILSRRPTKAWVRIPVLLSGERTSTLGRPGRELFIEAVEAVIAEGRVWDIGLWVGRAWSDEARCAAGVLVMGDDATAATEAAERLAGAMWSGRRWFTLVAEHHGAWDDALDFAAEAVPPVFISDGGDNVTAGGSGDIVFALAETRRARAGGRRLPRFLFAGIVDPPSVAAAADAGEGAVVERAIGGVVDARFADPVAGSWRVERVFPGTTGPVGALLVDGDDAAIVQRGRAPFVGAGDPAFTKGMLQDEVPFEFEGFDVVVVKNGYLFPTQRAVAASAFLAITPGGSDLDFSRLDYRRRPRPMYPLDDDFDPDLTAVVMTPA